MKHSCPLLTSKVIDKRQKTVNHSNAVRSQSKLLIVTTNGERPRIERTPQTETTR